MCLFELSVALCTAIRAIQALLIDDPTLTPKKGLLYLLLEQGVSNKPISPSSIFIADVFASGIVYFMSVRIFS
jgi:hypothetical protein